MPFSDYKIPVFSNTNLPNIPSVTQAPNGAYYINKHNQLVDNLIAASAQLPTDFGVFVGVFVNAADFGALGNLVWSKQSHEKVNYVSGADDTIAIQNALNAAGAKVSNNKEIDTEGNAICFIPAGNYRITSTLTIPPNVVIWSEGFLFNFLSNDWTPMIIGSRHSHCKKLQIHANGKTGIRWGEPGTSSAHACNLESIVIWHVGVNYESSKPGNQQKCGLRLHGLDYRIGHYWVKGGNIGLDIYQCSDVLAANVFLIGCSTGLRMTSAEQVNLASVCIDTNIKQGIVVDNSNNCKVQANAFVNSDSYGTPMTVIAEVGTYSANKNKNITLDLTAQCTGGYGLKIANAIDCRIELNVSNARTYSQTDKGGTATSHWIPTATGGLLVHNIGTIYNNNGTTTPAAAIQYGTNLSGYLDVTLNKSPGITSFLGTQYGILKVLEDNAFNLYKDGVARNLLAPISLASWKFKPLVDFGGEAITNVELRFVPQRIPGITYADNNASIIIGNFVAGTNYTPGQNFDFTNLVREYGSGNYYLVQIFTNPFQQIPEEVSNVAAEIVSALPYSAAQLGDIATYLHPMVVINQIEAVVEIYAIEPTIESF